MRSRVNTRVSQIAEYVLRGASLLILAVLLWHALVTLDKRKEGYAAPADLKESLAAWSTRETPDRAHVVVDSVPEPGLSDWMVAMNGAGTKLTWQSTSPITAGGIAVEPVAEPKHSVRVWLGASARDTGATTTVYLRDALGLMDSTRVQSSGAMVTVPRVTGALSARIGNGGDASAIVRDSLIIRPVLVLATAGWEGKFVMTALEEYGWKTDGKFILSPQQNVVQGTTFNIDTSRYSAVIAVDGTAGQYASSIADYVRNGGGLVVLSEASSLGGLSGLLPAGGTGALQPAREVGIDSLAPRAGLALEPLTQLRPDAVVLEKRVNNVAVAARRYGKGRVLQIGYADTWRWRLGGEGEGSASGDADASARHRKWWTDIMSGVAYAPRVPLPLASNAPLDPAPLATFIEKLGVQVQKPKPAADTLADPRLLALLFGILMAMLLAEWASRRLRGAR